MKSYIKELLINAVTIAINIGLGFLATFIFSNDNHSAFLTFTFGFIIISILITYMISQKMGFKLDIFSYNIEETKFLILNSIFIGNLLSIPLTFIISSFL